MINKRNKMIKSRILVFRKSESSFEEPPSEDPFEGMHLLDDRPPQNETQVSPPQPGGSFLERRLGIAPKREERVPTEAENEIINQKIETIVSRPDHEHFQKINPMLHERSIPLF